MACDRLKRVLLDWNGLKWIGIASNGLVWVEVLWNRLDWVGIGFKVNRIVCNELKLFKAGCIGFEWIGIDCYQID